MRLEVIVDGQRRVLDLKNGEAEGRWEVDFDSTPLAADVREVEPGVYSILIDGRSHEVKIEAGADRCYAVLRGRRYEVQVLDPRRLERGRGTSSAAGRQRIVSPMPGRVVRVLVRAGEEVTMGQGIVVVEAMKMQNEIRSPKTGRVIALRVQEGAAVAGGETLAEVE
jgi:acetyl/propionyl-CoA carboxylase alpha subunit